MLRQGGVVAVKPGHYHFLKALGQILLYLVATVLLGALLAPPLFWMAQVASAHLHSAWLTAFLAKTEFPRYFDRGVMIAALLLLWPLLRALGIDNFGNDLGLVPDQRGPRRLLAGFLVAFGTLLGLGAILTFTGLFRMHSHVNYAKLWWLPLTALIVSIFEEAFFRGALQGAVRKTTAHSFAMVSVAVLYAIVHFLKQPDRAIGMAAIHWWSGLAILPDAFSQFREPGLLLGGFGTLLLVGVILGYTRERTRSLWMPVGLHSGWILGKMGMLAVTRQSVAWPWIGPNEKFGLIGLGPLLTLLLAWGIVWLMLRKI